MKRTQKSLRKIKLLVLLMLITIILSITATYAWFSTQRDVEITGMRLNIEVAESMQISLDGETWLQSIQIEDMKQFYGTYTENDDAHQAVKIADGTNLNYVPRELVPVSSDGTVTEGKLQFVQGTISGTSLTDISACSEDDITEEATIGEREEGNESHPYLIFDMYLRNISAKQDGEVDILKLNEGSKVWVNVGSTNDKEGAGTEDTGLEYSARVGLVLYGNAVDVTSTSGTISEDVRTIEADGNETVAIWEPNNLEHTPYVVSNNGMGITRASQAVTTYAIKSTVTGSVDDIYDTTDTTNLLVPYTMTPTYNNFGETIVEANLTAVDGTTTIGLKPNTMSKVRVYIWLEGQDPDCVDLASTGDKLNVELKLTKDETESTDEVTYTGTSSESGSGSGSEDSDSSNVITASTLYAMTEEEKKEIYGEVITNYAESTSDAQKSVNWKIFHSDGTNIYLIADDYVPRDYVPAGRNGIAVNANTSTTSYLRGFGMGDIVNDTASANKYNGTADWDSTIKAKWLREYTYTSTNSNVKATAYLLDKTQWSGFANSNYAEYAMGGPTLELFTASYNVTHPEKTIETQANETGYQVRWNGGTFANAISGLAPSESLYVISSNTNAEGMWVASPSASDPYTLLNVSYYGSVDLYDYNFYHTALGARPLVSLKSSVKIEKTEEGKYQIVE